MIKKHKMMIKTKPRSGTLARLKVDDFSFLKNKNILMALLATTFYDATFVVSTLNIVVNETINSSFLLFFYLASRKLIRAIIDIPISRLIDKKISLKNALIFALVLKMLFILAISSGNKYVLFCGIFCEGVSLSFFRGKSSVFQYRAMQLVHQEAHYPLLNTLAVLLVYTFTILNSAIGIFLLYRYSVLVACIATNVMMLISIVCIHTTKINTTKATFKPGPSSLKTKNSSAVGKRVIFCSILLGICGLGWELNTLNQFLTLKLINNPKFASMIFEYNSIAMMIGAVAAMLMRNQSLRFSSPIFIFVLAINTFLPIIIKPEYVPFVIITYSFFFNIHENLLRINIMKGTANEQQCFALSVATTTTAVLTILIQGVFVLGGQYLNPILVNSFIFGGLAILATIGSIAITKQR